MSIPDKYTYHAIGGILYVTEIKFINSNIQKKVSVYGAVLGFEPRFARLQRTFGKTPLKMPGLF